MTQPANVGPNGETFPSRREHLIYAIDHGFKTQDLCLFVNLEAT